MTADIQRVGQTGARFGRASRRPKAAPKPQNDPSTAPSDGSAVPPQRESQKPAVPPLPQPQRPPVPPLPRPQRAPAPNRAPVPPQRGPLFKSLLGNSPPRTSPEPLIDPNDFDDPRGFGDPFGEHFDEHGDPEIDHEAVSAPTVRVRPYIHTGGRTRISAPLPIESMVCTRPGVSSLRLNGAHRWVAELCSTPQSVAEVSARLGVPLAVARVVVDDLVEQRMVTVQRGVENRAPDLPLMRRVLAGLRKL